MGVLGEGTQVRLVGERGRRALHRCESASAISARTSGSGAAAQPERRTARRGARRMREIQQQATTPTQPHVQHEYAVDNSLIAKLPFSGRVRQIRDCPASNHKNRGAGACGLRHSRLASGNSWSGGQAYVLLLGLHPEHRQREPRKRRPATIPTSAANASEHSGFLAKCSDIASHHWSEQSEGFLSDSFIILVC